MITWLKMRLWLGLGSGLGLGLGLGLLLGLENFDDWIQKYLND